MSSISGLRRKQMCAKSIRTRPAAWRQFGNRSSNMAQILGGVGLVEIQARVFIGSSRVHSNVARFVASRLESDDVAEVTVWDEGVFGLNQSVLDRLLGLASDFDFAES